MKSKINFWNFSLLLGFLVLVVRLIQLQLVLGEKYRRISDENRILKIKINSPRGIIFDRHGEILAKNLAVYKLKEAEKERIISRDEALKLQAYSKDETLYIDFARAYPQAQTFAHVVGYLGEIEAQNSKLKTQNYEIGDLIGKTAVEEFYEEKLRGKSGGELVEIDTLGKILRRIGQVEPVAGQNLTLAIDADLQRVAADQMLGKKGAIVASNPANGEILLLYSSPSFDPNVFLDQRFQETVKKLITDFSDRPLINRVISGIYPPGSTFKIITAVAGLEEGKINRNTLINDPGVIYIGPYKYANWYFTGYGRVEGEINIVKAIKRSTDTFFYKLGEVVGIEKLVFWAKKFSLDKTFGIDLPAELAGFVPTPEWKEKVKKEPWFLGNTYHLSIGQGDVALTPLAVNMMTSVIANGGKICQPRMLKIGPDEKVDCPGIGIKSQTIDIIKEGMIGACSTGGTAWPFFDFKPEVACKTGTSEYVDVDGKTKSHAWLTVFAPADKPEISLTVLVEGGGEGSSVAGPIAKEILKEYFKNQ